LYKIMREYDDRIPALVASPPPQESKEPFPLVFPESPLAHKYCVGRGLEIGGSAHNPFGLHTRNVDMTDSMETVFKREEIRLCGRALPVDIVAGGDAVPCPGESQDFIVSSHVLEHFPDPIKALLEWDRLVRPGGVIFMIVPHKDRTFDSEKPRTPLQHLIDDYRKGNTESHGDRNGHDHCWITEDLIELVRWMIANLGVHWEIAEVRDRDDKVGNGFTLVIRKLAAGIAGLLEKTEELVRNSRGALRGVEEAPGDSRIPAAALEKAIRELSAERLSPKAAMELGELCFSANLMESAAGFFQQALRADPGNAEILNDLGVLCHRLGDMELARDCLVRSLEAAPGNMEALSNLARLPVRA
jgi:SAM-dependent methyltransferase